MDGANVSKIIKDMVKSGKIPGAFIFEGERGADALADALAKAIVCQNTESKAESGEACGVCAGCVKATKGTHPDIIAPEPGGEGALSFHIDKVRDIIDGLYLAPNESGTKVYMIKDMHNMTPQAQNALLKSLEDPPPFAVFIITANDGGLILETVKSRAVRFSPVYTGKTEKKAPPPAYSGLILDILGQTPDKSSLYQKLSSSGLEKSDKAEVINFYTCIENALRDILAAKFFAGASPDIDFLYFDGFEETDKLSNLYPTKKLLEMLKKIRKYKSDLDYNINIRLNLNAFLSNL